MDEAQKDSKKILMLTTFAFFVSVMVWFNMAPFNSTIMAQLGISKEEIGVLMLVNLAFAIPARIIMGRLVDRFGPKKVFSSLLVIMSLPCFVFAFGDTYWQLLLSRLLLGIIGASFVVGIRMISEWFPQQKAGFFQGIYAGWGNFGSAMASFSLPLFALWLGGENGWRYAIALTGLIALVYGIIYYIKVEDTPPGREFKKSSSAGGLEVTSHRDLVILLLTSFPIYGGMAVLVWSLQRTSVLPTGFAAGLYVFLGILYTVNAWKTWRRNRAYLQTEIKESEKYSMKQVSVLSFAYFTTFGAELAVVSMLPMFFQEIFALGAVGAGMIASSFAFTNLVARPAGGWLSDRFGRKRMLTMLLLLLSGLYFMMSTLSGQWPVMLAVVLTMSCSMVGQAAAGSVFSMVPLVKKSKTGQIAGMVGAYGNVGSVCFLAVLNFLYPSVFFITIGSVVLFCFIASFFIQDPGLLTEKPGTTKKGMRTTVRYPSEMKQNI